MTSRLQARLLAQRALFQRLQSSKKRNKLQGGFTLIELLIVVIIIGILAAIALPSFLGQRDRAYLATAKSWASAEARKCSASQAAAGSAVDFTATPTPNNGGNNGGADIGPNVSVTAGNCGTMPATWTATYKNIDYNYTVSEGGSMVATES